MLQSITFVHRSIAAAQDMQRRGFKLGFEAKTFQDDRKP